MKRIGRFLLLLALVTPASARSQVAPSPEFPLYDRYMVAALNGQRFPADASITVKRRTADNSLFAEGYAGCGWWAAAVELGGKNQFRVVGLQATSSACPHSGLEKQFLAALKKVTRWRMEGKTLILEGAGIRLGLSPLPLANWI